MMMEGWTEEWRDRRMIMEGLKDGGTERRWTGVIEEGVSDGWTMEW